MTDPDPNTLQQRYQRVLNRIRKAEAACDRPAGGVNLLAVSKTKGMEEIASLADLGQRGFGESYLQEALQKIDRLRDRELEWHFIGRIQSNKTRPIAENFDWVHSLASLKHAIRLNDQRPPDLPPLNVCLQVNTSGETSKDGYSEEALREEFEAYTKLPNLRIRGLMTIPAPGAEETAQHRPFERLRLLRDELTRAETPLDTLSMGMSEDLEAAIAEGATIIRIGTAIFGPRQYNQ
ncbi:MAG: YggS family pyridoxal phosphate-dependent enzyme [Candidatus Thiodiazotropha sp. (ex Ctena orbiculata)]|nr:YggS family pyridoxal phosphate-dependent enzyme [Candidatus Thiodiazotropha taylori]PVV25803.1 MAG: YggS family pyridoxal phosphate enzyme [gamma proteobacterium symbiont of Ctena orbiculata]MBT2996255.1 YggS family pyridoxal phosphate-dependent enzyme [Candidatus Thiodiazotropha taylori]MBT2999599.1 YggS family pyridoxal phosphate-dependent enzyme [Candidatus Thiodiazotropha taylori]MBV2106244.1 YggS family pyridoxal phosphate-dependent enzyme [Candidatus Thiodiazotropha taylori]